MTTIWSCACTRRCLVSRTAGFAGATPIEAATTLARERVRKQPLSYLLRRWWTRKYRLPPTSDEYLNYTAEELLCEYLEDVIESSSSQKVQREVDGATGESYFVTDDELANKWEREIARGVEPDYDEGRTEGQRQREEEHLRMASAARAEAEGFQGIEDRFEADEVRLP